VVICGLEVMIYNVNKIESVCGLDRMWKKISRQIWDNICIVTDMKDAEMT
jgi:hypothetical protein